jgi:uncharacterized Zn finger protein
MTNKEINCINTDEIVCPYCGYEHEDRFEDMGENGDTLEKECDECGEVFKFKTIIKVTFISSKWENTND